MEKMRANVLRGVNKFQIEEVEKPHAGVGEAVIGTPAMSSKPFAIEFRQVSISFEGKPALDDISFRLESGEMICITGTSGSGKSVLLRLAAGLLVPDAGQVLIEGREIVGLSEHQLLALRGSSMGIVFQDQSLFTGMTVFENAAYRLNEQQWSDDHTERAVREILAFVGLQADVDKLPEELSVGMKRRLEFARALVGWPKIMLLDEPTAGLDPINGRAMLDVVIRARDLHQISSLYVTKEIHEIPYLAGHRAAEQGAETVVVCQENIENHTRVLLLDEGRIAFLGSVADFLSSDLPAVIEMLRPRAGAPVATSYVTDPWRRKARTPLLKG